jgi:hypothetical protein
MTRPAVPLAPAPESSVPESPLPKSPLPKSPVPELTVPELTVPGQAKRSGYLARPGRRALVAADLGGLHGPVTGVVELPLRLFWSLPDHKFDLDDADTRRWYYETVLREASRPDDLADFLDGATLARLWPELYLPKGVRRAWEERHPALRAAVAA